jgi:biopolymer transport protein ExbD/biopolymer transport protein TolR
VAFGRLERAASPRPMSDINVTPLVDVMLVLLVIFIVTAPLIGSSLKLDLPEAEGAAPSDAPAFLELAIDAEGRHYLGDTPVDADALVERVRAAARDNPATEVRLRADETVPYGRVAALIGRVQAAGLTRIGLVAAPPAAAD